ncbi:Putative NADPH-quinone reductase (modulator of drug activity B) [Nannocystis exedens]|uniref:Putative NADPH-quinone reductase (Modulator of drug activity B) n=1 Tax=Nannocystis exedens TaxID=54 RepID=A0A1I1WN95_9BACT|nr:NAD(P)H-dependent oxidoreductase [Nannocystis exedens]PCC67723.1 NAD(P)H dehydrogenase [Nannocystis exedens]SFD94570.1 Putative NADPH-quinone reductase (modulator of drug activity B) [Nannocystis exedens]
MKRALILLGHADPASFNAAVARAYQAGFRIAGGEAEIVTLSDLRFDPVLRRGFRGDQALEPDLVALRARIEAAAHLVWVFPTWWVSPPAVVRALVDRLFLPDWAFAYRPGKALPEGLLAGRSARVLTTMDSPSWWYALWHYRALHGSFVNGTLRFVGLAPVKLSALFATRTRTAAQRQRWLAEVQATAAADHARCRVASRPARSELGATSRALAP